MEVFKKYSFCKDYTNLFLKLIFFLVRISAVKRLWINISFVKIYKFLWCIETDLADLEFSLCRRSWNVGVPSLYMILRALSCIEFFISFLRYSLTNTLMFLQRQRVRTKTLCSDHYTIKFSLYLIQSLWWESTAVPDIIYYQSSCHQMCSIKDSGTGVFL